jgi:DNA-binding XRE family transcriptional regulator
MYNSGNQKVVITRRGIVEEKSAYLYFIGADGVDFIKVGRSKNPKSRLRTLRTGSPYKLQLLRVYPASGHLEKFVLSALRARSSLNGEWFLSGKEDFDALVQQASVDYEACGEKIRTVTQRSATQRPLSGLGYEIRKARIAKGWQQNELCEVINLSQKHMSAIELDKVDPRISIVQRIAVALGVSMAQLTEEQRDES